MSDLLTAAKKVLAYRRGEGHYNFSRYWLSSERELAMMEEWEKIEEELEAAVKAAEGSPCSSAEGDHQ